MHLCKRPYLVCCVFSVAKGGIHGSKKGDNLRGMASENISGKDGRGMEVTGGGDVFREGSTLCILEIFCFC